MQYYDEHETETLSESSEGALTWRRKSVSSDQRMCFVSCEETDTHVQMVLTADRKLVVAFRGTGSMNNVGTDCSVSRIGVTLDQHGLEFDAEDSLQVCSMSAFDECFR